MIEASVQEMLRTWRTPDLKSTGHYQLPTYNYEVKMDPHLEVVTRVGEPQSPWIDLYSTNTGHTGSRAAFKPSI